MQVRAMLGMDEDLANDLEIAAGALTGEVREPVLGRDAKEAALLRIAAAHGVDAADAVTVGDGANDLPMLQACNGAKIEDTKQVALGAGVLGILYLPYLSWRIVALLAGTCFGGNAHFLVNGGKATYGKRQGTRSREPKNQTPRIGWQRRNCRLIFQGPHLHFIVNLLENVRLPAHHSGPILQHEA
jgi:hypothetical protein